MKKIIAITAILSAVAGFSATSAYAAAYMKLGDIKGESAQQTQHGHARVRGGLNPANTLQAPHKPQQMQHGHARVRGGLNPANTIQAPQKEQRMLLPAVQNVRGHR